MAIASDLDLHFWITRGMARRMGVNLANALQADDLTHADIAAMITACRACGRGDVCLALLSERGTAIDTPPAECPNKRVLESLRTMH